MSHWHCSGEPTKANNSTSTGTNIISTNQPSQTHNPNNLLFIPSLCWAALKQRTWSQGRRHPALRHQTPYPQVCQFFNRSLDHLTLNVVPFSFPDSGTTEQLPGSPSSQAPPPSGRHLLVSPSPWQRSTPLRSRCASMMNSQSGCQRTCHYCFVSTFRRVPHSSWIFQEGSPQRILPGLPSGAGSAAGGELPWQRCCLFINLFSMQPLPLP